jgi:hypothetical protein
MSKTPSPSIRLAADNSFHLEDQKHALGRMVFLLKVGFFPQCHGTLPNRIADAHFSELSPGGA